MASTRPAAVAGSFYPATAPALRALLDDCFLTSPLGPGGKTQVNPAILAGMVPHAGPIYSGPCAAHFYSSLEPSIQRIILLGVNHRARGARAALSPWRFWRTPLGEVGVDDAFSSDLESEVKFLRRDEYAHLGEHSIEVQLPFLQRVLGAFQFVPISLSHLSVEECAELGAAVAQVFHRAAAQNVKTLILASSDLNHYLSPSETEELDRLAIEQVLALDPVGLIETVENKNISMCGVVPTAVMLYAAKAAGARRARLLKHCHSGDVAPMNEVVGYASIALER
ncbi:MAG TPA: AmmeMemoRadiSam system protein B [Candidatus Binatia bacterium]|nr:AmmeMemoRadiSam system protein B [Candidatus Binatia bacterium]